MREKELFPSLIGFTFFSLIVMVVLRWLDIPAGDLLDWVVGIGGFWVLIFVTTVPWNTHFRAKEVLSDAKSAEGKARKVSEKDLYYVKRIARLYLLIALALHVISAAGLYLLAVYNISKVGYWGAVLALLLTGLRPASRLYAYIHYRLTSISQEIHFPKEDVSKLQVEVTAIKDKLEAMHLLLHPDEKGSWTQEKTKELKRLESQMYALKESTENFQLQQNTKLKEIQTQNEKQIAQISEDAQFLAQVRELIRFIKKA